MSHARIEEVSDSDIDSDPSEGNISDVGSDFEDHEIFKPRTAPAPRPDAAKASLINPSSISAGSSGAQFSNAPKGDESIYKDFQCIYPVYFDKNRSRKEGRRVGVELAVENPMAREIVNACGRLGLNTLFEPSRFHPKDWANPGRIKVQLKKAPNRGGPVVKNKHHLYILISKHLIANPTTRESASAVKIPGLNPPDPSKPYPTPAVPKGWKMGTILPFYSPGLTGGGVSENFFKDMMAEMQGQVPGMPDMGALAGGSGGAIEPKKEKKDKKKKGKS